jgi:hypothetical protein
MNLDRRLAELLGICWHEYENSRPKWLGDNCLKCGKLYRDERDDNPHLSTDSVALLRALMDLPDWDEFLVEHGAVGKHSRDFDMLPVRLIRNPKEFAQAAAEFLAKKGELK